MTPRIWTPDRKIELPGRGRSYHRDPHRLSPLDYHVFIPRPNCPGIFAGGGGGGGGGGVAFVAADSANNSGTGARTILTGFDPGASNFALAFACTDGTDIVTGYTLNGAAFTLAFRTSSSGTFTGLSVWYLANPTVGDLIVTSSGAEDGNYGIATFSGVNVASPLGTWQNNANTLANNDTTPTITGVDATGLYVNVTNGYHGSSSGAVTFNGGETPRINRDFATRVCLAVSTKAGSASTTVGTTIANATRINVAGVYLKA